MPPQESPARARLHGIKAGVDQTAHGWGFGPPTNDGDRLQSGRQVDQPTNAFKRLDGERLG